MKQITNWIKWTFYWWNSSGTSVEWGWSSGWSCGVYGLSDQLIRAAIRSIINESQWTHSDAFPHYNPPSPFSSLRALWSHCFILHCYVFIVIHHDKSSFRHTRLVLGRTMARGLLAVEPRSGRTWGKGREGGSPGPSRLRHNNRKANDIIQSR